MDAAQMLTAQEIARQCEYLAGIAEQRAPEEAPGREPGARSASALPAQGRTRHLRLADPVTEPIQRVTDPSPVDIESDAERGASLGLTSREWGILAFERQWWKREGAKERAIRELFDLSPSRYYQLLNALLDKPEAQRADPMLVKRLHRVRQGRQQQRNAAVRSFPRPSRETEE